MHIVAVLTQHVKDVDITIFKQCFITNEDNFLPIS